MTARARPSSSSSALRVAQYVFTRSITEPTMLYLDGTTLGGGLPPGRLPLAPLRDLLLRPEVTLQTRDLVWRELIRRAREDRSSWLVGAIGMAMPGLRRVVRRLQSSGPGERDDLESAVAEGFVAALYAVDLDDRALCARLVDAGHRAGARQQRRDARIDAAAWMSPVAQRPPQPGDHPDIVLVRAVHAGILTLDEARLIGATRLEHLQVKDIAAWQAELPTTVAARRRRAERRLCRAILAGDLTAGPAAARCYPDGSDGGEPR